MGICDIPKFLQHLQRHWVECSGCTVNLTCLELAGSCVRTGMWIKRRHTLYVVRHHCTQKRKNKAEVCRVM